MSQYYFFVATLPQLAFDQEQATTPAEFLETCRGYLSPRDLELVGRAVLAPSGEPTEAGIDYLPQRDGERLVVSWLNWESRLRDELARLRAGRLGVEPARYLSGAAYLSGLEEIARAAIGAASPLAAEELLDQARWHYLDVIEVGHYFDAARLVVYYLRLQLLERRAQRRRERGERRFGELYAAIMPETFSRQFGLPEAESNA